MKPTITACLFAAACLPAAAAPKYLLPDYAEVRLINMALLAGNCEAALSLMKAGVKKRQPDVLLVGGTMFENGTCMKPDWDKAVNLYQLADQAGNRSAIPRLMAGFAHPGRDNGLALWWAAQYEPEDGTTAPQAYRTTVRVLADESALAFAIRAWRPQAESVNGGLARRDKVARDQDFSRVPAQCHRSPTRGRAQAKCAHDSKLRLSCRVRIALE